MTDGVSGVNYRIGDLTLDASSKTLYRSGKVVPLSYRSALLLLEMARNHPNVVRRIDLIETLWPREEVTDQALSQRISILRRELGDAASEPRYIGRVWGWGYHLLAPVERLPAGASPLDLEPASRDGGPAPAPAQPQPPAPPATPAPRVAVLGFRNESSDAGTNWLATGLTDAVCADLARRGQVALVARQLVHSLLSPVPDDRTEEAELGRAADLLGVRWLVAGSYTRLGAGLQISLVVFDGEAGKLIRLEPISGRWQDLFALQDEAVECLAEQLSLSLTKATEPPGASRETLEAFEAYSLGKRLFTSEESSSLEEARQQFSRAIALSPGYAMAHSGLGSVLALRFAHRGDAQELERAINHLRRALELDPEITEPYPWLCHVLMRLGRFEESLAMGARGVELQPDDVHAPYFLGLAHLVHAERVPDRGVEAVRWLGRATEVDPGVPAAWQCLAHAALLRGDIDRAEVCSETALSLERTGSPTSRGSGAGLIKGQVLLRRGQPAEAAEAFAEAAAILERSDHTCRETLRGLCACGVGEAALRLGDANAALPHYRRAWQLTSQFPLVLGAQRVRLLAAAGLAAAYAATQEKEKAAGLAREATTGLQAVGPESWVAGAGKPQIAYQTALAWLKAGNGPAAMACLEAAVSSGWRDVEWLERDPELGGLRRLSGFISLLSRASKCRAPALSSH